MVKRFRLRTRAFGSEPRLPEITVLSDWVAGHRGRLADITTYRLEAPLALQAHAGITTPCAGGRFYSDRILAALDGIDNNHAVGELHVDTRDLIEDAAGIVITRKGAWCAAPAPHVLGITDTYFHDPMEWTDAICGAYRTILRAMRDTGVDGHVLICDTIDREELSALVQPKVFFFLPEPDRRSLSILLERQSQVAVTKKHLPLLFSLTDEYELSRLYLLDPDPASIASALAHIEADNLVASGYCAGCDDTYWDELAASAGYSI